ncbi:hypothetical protein DLAC_09543 [Tieghemostelium lacteum]|uniref:Fungal lipase-type domain-containing protein n=1 Tax=Tieghemostelium lacteum TaxID=361077 RepID=A0A151Z6N1_TIELA|nr:hypothetical protein DLAC_09543 [Tieghemostelium lacteum]|eukprot:KYQ89588.1 hypothetical protein DLAC_09543 [Tieghemostelium lacteum]
MRISFEYARRMTNYEDYIATINSNSKEWINEMSIFFKDVQSCGNQKSFDEDRFVMSSILSKASYFKTREEIENVLESYTAILPPSSSNVIEKLYSFQPCHSSNKVIVAMDRMDNMYCAFSGTENTTDLALDVACGFMEKIHLHKPHSLYNTINRYDWITTIIEDLCLLSVKCGRKNLVFTGHSIAGLKALCSILTALEIQSENQIVKSSGLSFKYITFGGPSYLHQEALKTLQDNQQPMFYSFINEFDIVPVISHHVYIFIDLLSLVLIMVYTLVGSILSRSIPTFYQLSILSIPFLLVKLWQYVYTLIFDNGYQPPCSLYYNSKNSVYDQLHNVECQFTNNINNIKRLWNLDKFVLAKDHLIDCYIERMLQSFLDRKNNVITHKPPQPQKPHVKISKSKLLDCTKNSNLKKKTNSIIFKGMCWYFVSQIVWFLLSMVFLVSLFPLNFSSDSSQ